MHWLVQEKGFPAEYEVFRICLRPCSQPADNARRLLFETFGLCVYNLSRESLQTLPTQRPNSPFTHPQAKKNWALQVEGIETASPNEDGVVKMNRNS